MFNCCCQEPQDHKLETESFKLKKELAMSSITSEYEAVAAAVPSSEQDADVQAAAAFRNPVVSISKVEGADLGMILDRTDPKNLVLREVFDGLLKTAAEASETEVKAGFRIVKVNGTSATAEDMVAIIRQEKNLEMEFEAFEEKHIQINKGDSKLGVALRLGIDGNWITITCIEGEGVIPDWNAAAAPEQNIMVSDKIVAIDRQEAKAQEMVRWMQERSSMELTVYSWKSLQA